MSNRTKVPADIIPIEIRPSVFVWIAGVPHDLSEVEAKKVANVVRAYAVKNDDGNA